MTSPDRPLVGIVDYGMGNLRSVSKMVERCRADWRVTDDPGVIAAADRLILPGVGAFRDGMENLRRRGLIEPLNEAVQRRRTPILGICLGMELMAQESEENGLHRGLGWIPARVRRLAGNGLRIPHVGWNGFSRVAANPLFDDLPETATFYYVHSYVLDCAQAALVAGTCTYGETFAAAVRLDNIFGCQFHPEKSQRNGAIVLARFIHEDLA